jgi:glycerol-3-phosphate dehydrogenase subunit B
MNAAPSIHCDLCVIGSGMAGMSAALFAVKRGLATVLVGRTGEIIFTSGLLDLMAVHPVEKGEIWDDPWACIERLVQDLPKHPYAQVPAGKMRSAFDELSGFLGSMGLPYTGYHDRNARVLTSVGTFKPTFRVPATMWQGVEICRRMAPCLIADIQGLKGFSAGQIAATAGAAWPGLRTVRLGLPGMLAPGELFPERLGRALEVAANRAQLAAAIAPHVKGIEAVGLPAMLGVSGSAEVMGDLQIRLGKQVFEIPTMPPGVAGLRLKEAFERGLKDLGAGLFLENRVFRAEADSAGEFRLHAGRSDPEEVITARAVILATGRFMGGGLHADRRRVRESLFNLPVHQPAERAGWHREDFLDRRGHAVNRAGIEIDSAFHPLDPSGRPAHRRLFAAGSILAHQDWMRMKCGSGLAIATAYAAVEGVANELS